MILKKQLVHFSSVNLRKQNLQQTEVKNYADQEMGISSQKG